jgi:hypothetical protein
MKITETTSYPHPVLAPWSEDIQNARFETHIAFQLDEEQNQVTVRCEATLDHPDLRALIESGSATFGCFIKCEKTGLRRLQPLGFPAGSQQFASGALLGRVELRPMIWSARAIGQYLPSGAHAEFAEASDIDPGQILALDDAQVIDITRPPLPPLESIFEIQLSDDVADGTIEIDTDMDRVTVRMPKATYDLVQDMRSAHESTRAVLMNALYVPIIMEILDQLRYGDDQFEQHRWLHPFRARCELAGVDITKPDLFNDAQRLLQQPFASLSQLIDYGDEE